MSRKISYKDAINEALSQEMERDDKIIVMGLDNAGGRSRIVAMSFCEPRSWTRVLSS